MNTRTENQETAEEAADIPAANPVYDRENPHLAAECIYLYYLKVTGDPKEETRVFVLDRGRPIRPDEMHDEIEVILNEIRDGQHHPCGWKIGDVRWRRKSYLVFLLDDRTHVLEEGNAVTFDPDASFRDGHDTEPFPPPFDHITGFYCINHLRGHDEPSEPEEIVVTVNHPHRRAQSGNGTRSHEDSGTNLGPPVPPP